MQMLILVIVVARVWALIVGYNKFRIIHARRTSGCSNTPRCDDVCLTGSRLLKESGEVKGHANVKTGHGCRQGLGSHCGIQ